MADLKIFTDRIEPEAMAQIDRLLKQSAFKNSKIRIMPDVHKGMGCVIGFTGNLGDKVIPNIVGVDIGCGLVTAKLGKIELDLKELDCIINKHIPSGFKTHNERIVRFKELTKLKCYRSLNDTKRLERSIGTLGGGNHFIEVAKDLEDNLYLVIHTGSRNLGKQVAEYYQKLAIKTCKVDIPSDLAYLTGTDREDYLHDMNICLEFASLNRKTILDLICKHANLKVIDSFETIHNFIDTDSNIVRKGAISAKSDEILTIPINMRDGSIIGIGLGNSDWNYSAPHGAGRIMSRMKAKKTLNYNKFKVSMKDVYSTSVNIKTLDEAPFVYKPINEILDNVTDTIKIIKIIKPIYNFKASN